MLRPRWADSQIPLSRRHLRALAAPDFSAKLRKVVDAEGGGGPKVFEPQGARMAAVITLNIQAGKLNHEP